ncbi:Gfo/Idh/MocA family protein [Zunongwangia profunda]|jgi:predicted dehydrogenase|uniref:Gfo/Idh/MocA family protein n=1 Tax=Zunongwangia profunda TaxID=398743 RepID=UPI001D187689|nr:Gfo/Idh/MocA family oxidoreductase [Zunongwangia profunda]MCC4228155.1 Gfo/Idh/MocA family oxidoreductase [Zunongwangia profunda]|tara:strand:+ start:7180 stop:8523 length:1344 start_codon:yes stop_codon:yes gene_type:complete
MKNNRRNFIKELGILSMAGVTLPPGQSVNSQTVVIPNHLQKVKKTTPVNIGLIGAGGMGMSDLKTALEVPDINLIAVCDLYQARLERAKSLWGNTLLATTDYNVLLQNEDIDAVIIATPDHLHKKISVDALKADKHVYCEKPMLHSINEGNELVNAWKKSGKVYQVGSQGLSSLGNEKAKELLEQGAIGNLNYAEGFWARNSPVGAWQYPIPKDASSDTIDWERFIEEAPNHSFDPVRFFRWRNYLDYGTGMAGDLFVHLFSSLHFITNSLGPTKIAAMGGLRFWKDGREVPDVLLGMFDYPNTKNHPGFNLSLRCNFVDGTSGNTYLRLVGDKGAMDIEWDRVVLRKNEPVSMDDPFSKEKAGQITPSEQRKKMLPPPEMIYEAEKGYKGAHYDHFSNFFEAIRNGNTLIEDPEFGFRAAAPALLCNQSYLENTILGWDPEKMKII